MTPVEAAEVVDRLIAPFPGPPWPQQTLDAWTDAVARSSAKFGPALGVADRWAEAHDRAPSLHQFLAAIAPPPPPAAYVADPDDWRPHPALAAELEKALATTRTGESGLTVAEATRRNGNRGVDGHWHGGPNPCAMCGGIRPGAVRSTPAASTTERTTP